MKLIKQAQIHIRHSSGTAWLADGKQEDENVFRCPKEAFCNQPKQGGFARERGGMEGGREMGADMQKT